MNRFFNFPRNPVFTFRSRNGTSSPITLRQIFIYACPAREEALALLKKYNSEPFHIQHALTVEGVMRWYANELGYGEDADFWATVGLLHDVDFEKWPEQH